MKIPGRARRLVHKFITFMPKLDTPKRRALHLTTQARTHLTHWKRELAQSIQ